MEATSYPLSEIAAVLRAILHGSARADLRVAELLTDSRQFVQPSGTLFFALVSKRNDGHRYIGELYEKGVRSFVVSDGGFAFRDYPEAVFLVVPDTLLALQQLAAWHRRQFGLTVVGITGSNGKTIVKEWLYQLLQDDLKIVRSPKSYNSQTGVPLSVWQIGSGDELALIEAGISEPDEMNRLQPVILPGIGIFTNIGQAHAGNFINKDQKIAEKLKLFTHVETLIFCSDHLDIQQRIISTEAFRKLRLFTWGRKKDSDLVIESIDRNVRWTDIHCRFEGRQVHIRLPFVDDASIENVMHCWAFMLLRGVPDEIILQRVSRLSPVAMRMELKEGINNCTIINDSYSSDINSLSIALDFLNQQKQHRRKTVILSDLLQSGRNENDLYAWIADLLANKEVDQLIGIGPAITRHAARFRMNKSFFAGTEDFLKKFPFSNFQHESILIKGARVFNFEDISKALQQKAHETVLEINLNALVHNLNLIRSRLKPGVKTMVMVKAFSYGSGSYEIANLLQFHQVDYLAVAYADEGVELRRAGISLPVMVMNPDEESIDALSKYHLEPEVYNFRILDLIEESRQRLSGGQQGRIFIHLKLDTGMNRLGFREEDLELLIKRLDALPYIHVKSVFSHLAASEMPQHDPFTLEQISRFSSMTETLRAEGRNSFIRHILNSAGLCRFPDAQFDMVRIGISLYGVAVCPGDEGRLQQVSSLRSMVSQIRQLEAGETVGYGRSWTARRQSRIAVVPIGYADGLPRALGNGRGKLMINGTLVPIIGEVCMDMCMVDVSGVEAREGDVVLVFGKDKAVTEFAAAADTIPYEILTRISRRVKRVYYQE
ncbi:MAG TPA: bifunctional UDP-N-acetylmuramoyl-tripeptide:D-alanyl-D-alanine ligase/alanine racemase [Bacteroidales bacterium]|nr:bifunctional UDP-N-acetylmuramoyl-tripeptide:D-alanyl-D-alanine ligase/alanine racemase [Bacteroidales bacterium]HSA43163.1 bifunctional UDP-N-acetylmuramoyl-tripeptide:D-alanyl-D-alanine ligase/alanine racemase [Bacteroidales bacterium]